MSYSIELVIFSIAVDSSMTLSTEQMSAPAVDLCSSLLPVRTNSVATPSKNSVCSNICLPYEYKINWGKRKKIRQYFNQIFINRI